MNTVDRFEQATLDTFCHAYTPVAGDVIVDIGAGVGEQAPTFSALVGAAGRVVCVEAHPQAYARLVETVRAHRLENVETVNLAVADRAGEIEISNGAGAGHVANTVIEPRDPIMVPAVTLDDIYTRCHVGRVDLLKMNIEGAEGLAIAGWHEAMRLTRNVVISCHDFLLPYGAPAAFATFEAVRAAVEAADFAVTTRPDDPRPWHRYYVYGAKL